LASIATKLDQQFNLAHQVEDKSRVKALGPVWHQFWPPAGTHFIPTTPAPPRYGCDSGPERISKVKFTTMRSITYKEETFLLLV